MISASIGLLLIGLLLDAVFITKREQKNLSAYLDHRVTNLSMGQRLSRFLKRVHAIIFERFFNANPFSIRFLLSATLTTSMLFGIVILIQGYLSSENLFLQLKIDLTQLSLVFVFVVFNIFFGYFTIIQTKIFIEASIYSKSLFRSIIFILSDLIVTVNSFILSYAFFILLVALWFVWKPQNIVFMIEDGQLERKPISEVVNTSPNRFINRKPMMKSQLELELEQQSKYEGSFRVILLPNGNEQFAEHMTIFYYSSFDFTDPEINAVLVKTFGSLKLKESEVTVMHEEKRMLELVNIWKRKFPNKPLSRDEKIVTFAANARVKTGDNIFKMYAESFSVVDELENNFPISLGSQMGLLDFPHFIERTVYSEFARRGVYDRLPRGSNPDIFCFDTKQPTIIKFEDGCGKFIDVQNSDTADRVISLIGRNLEGYFAPFNTLFITSVLPTIIVYLSMILLAVSILLFSYLIKRMARVRTFLFRAPMTVSGFLLGVVSALIGLI